MTDPIGIDFILKTRLPILETSDQAKGLPQPPMETPVTPSQALIDLPFPDRIAMPRSDLRDAIEDRHSVRRYAGEPLTLEELSYLLWCTQGVKAVTDRPATTRNVPSAGARHAFETYLLANSVEGLQPGLYRFLAIKHQLATVDLANDVAERICQACLSQEQIKTCAVMCIWAAVAYRMTWRYPQRGYRYIFLDAGHVCQNLYLSAGSIGCGVCAIGAFHDEEINTVLGLDGQEQFVIYGATVGRELLEES
ncbi:MAG: SagB/ThcOx family dehydrogenase [Anaerolineae bacterium]|nr:SagB/ThcOx family dehydrogenase [Anaerolineae bacterium]